MSKKSRTLLLSMVTACLCLVLIVVATYALFSDTVTVNNHLKAGKLEVGLERIGYTTCTLDDNGTLVVSPKDETKINLAEDASVLFEMDRVVPGCWYEAELEVSNNGDVAFDYGVKILWNESGTATELQLILASQIQITVTQGDKQTQFMLNAAKDVNFDEPLLAKSEHNATSSKTFTVRAEFVDDEENNQVQDTDLYFDLQVYATQVTKQE